VLTLFRVVNTCPTIHDPQNSALGVGENAAWGFNPPVGGVQAWFDEVSAYDLASNVCTTSATVATCGHYTVSLLLLKVKSFCSAYLVLIQQVMWAGTTNVGCAYAPTCTRGNAVGTFCKGLSLCCISNFN
jgi:hypothetical protein